jgi:RNA polymerase sigma-70 factor (ECF subfamily)
LELFNRLYKENYKSVFRLAYRFLRNHEAAADISQDVFLYLYKRLLKDANIENEKSWLYKVCSNLSLAHIKKNKRIIELNAQVKAENIRDENSESIVFETLQKLPKNDRMLLTLYNEGLSYKELAEVTGIKFTSVGKTLSRTLKKLKDEMERRK